MALWTKSSRWQPSWHKCSGLITFQNDLSSFIYHNVEIFITLWPLAKLFLHQCFCIINIAEPFLKIACILKAVSSVLLPRAQGGTAFLTGLFDFDGNF